MFETARGAPLHVGGIVVDGEMRYALEIPNGLSLLAHWDPDAEIVGLERGAAADQRPPVNVVHLAFQLMVGVGFATARAGGMVRRASGGGAGELPRPGGSCGPPRSPGVAAVLALEAGWVDHRGRPAAVDRLRACCAPPTRSTPRPGCVWGFVLVTAVYAVLTVATVYVLRRLARRHPGPGRAAGGRRHRVPGA